LSLPRDASVFYDVLPINGGYAVLTGHLDEIIRLRGMLYERTAILNEQNNVLSHTKELDGERAKTLAREALVNALDDSLRDKTDEINEIMKSLPDHPVPSDYDLTYKKLAMAKLIVNYCKRRGYITALETQTNLTDTSSLSLWLMEALFEAESCGIRGSVYENKNVPVPVDRAILLYEYFETVLESCLRYDKSMILVNVSADKRFAALRIAIETPEPWDGRRFEPKSGLRRALEDAKATIQMDFEENGLIVHLSIPAGGERNA
jgi:hypothetical protein